MGKDSGENLGSHSPWNSDPLINKHSNSYDLVGGGYPKPGTVSCMIKSVLLFTTPFFPKVRMSRHRETESSAQGHTASKYWRIQLRPLGLEYAQNLVHAGSFICIGRYWQRKPSLMVPSCPLKPHKQHNAIHRHSS